MVVSVSKKQIDIRDFGAEPGGFDCTAAFQDALTAATATNHVGGVEVFVPPVKTFWGVTTISLAGKTAVLVGHSERSIIRQLPGASGPVLDLSNHNGVGNNFGFRPHRNLRIEGNQESGNQGVRIVGANNTGLTNVSIKNTGAQGIFASSSNFMIFRDLVIGTPVEDQPYIHSRGVVNEILWDNVGLRAEEDRAGPNAHILIEPDAEGMPVHQQWFHTWTEFCKLGEGARVFDVMARDCIFQFPLTFDMLSTVNAATNNAIMLMRDSRLGAPAAPYVGGNQIWGIIDGKIQDPDRTPAFNANQIAWGIRCSDSGLRVTGSRGFQGQNVRLEPGVEDCFIDLRGGSTDQDDNFSSVVDNSGNTLNTVLDTWGEHKYSSKVTHAIQGAFQAADAAGVLRTLNIPAGGGSATWV